MARWNGKNPKPGTKRIDRNRLEKCFQDHGIDYRDFGIDFGYSKSWVQSAMCAGMASAPLLKALETIGIKYEDIAPIDMWNVVDEGGAEPPKEDGITKDELYHIIFNAVRDALNGEEGGL